VKRVVKVGEEGGDEPSLSRLPSTVCKSLESRQTNQACGRVDASSDRQFPPATYEASRGIRQLAGGCGGEQMDTYIGIFQIPILNGGSAA
jgi:hypothetical protein